MTSLTDLTTRFLTKGPVVAYPCGDGDLAKKMLPEGFGKIKVVSARTGLRSTLGRGEKATTKRTPNYTK